MRFFSSLLSNNNQNSGYGALREEPAEEKHLSVEMATERDIKKLEEIKKIITHIKVPPVVVLLLISAIGSIVGSIFAGKSESLASDAMLQSKNDWNTILQNGTTCQVINDHTLAEFDDCTGGPGSSCHSTFLDIACNSLCDALCDADGRWRQSGMYLIAGAFLGIPLSLLGIILIMYHSNTDTKNRCNSEQRDFLQAQGIDFRNLSTEDLAAAIDEKIIALNIMLEIRKEVAAPLRQIIYGYV
jgi:hypothetical protein